MTKKKQTDTTPQVTQEDWRHQRDVECINTACRLVAEAVNRLDGAQAQIEVAFYGNQDWNDMIKDSLKDALAILGPVLSALYTWWDEVPENLNHKDGTE